MAHESSRNDDKVEPEIATTTQGAVQTLPTFDIAFSH